MDMQKNSKCWYYGSCQLENCSENCAVYMQMKWQMDASGLPEVRQKPIKLYITDSNEVDRAIFGKLSKIRSDIVSFVEAGRNLAIVSDKTGNGKTSWAVKMLQTYLHYTAIGNYENLKGMFVNVPDLLLRLKDFQNPVSEEYKNNLRNVDLVVWDEVAMLELSNYDYSQIYAILDSRLFSGKANIYTFNFTKKEDVEKLIGVRLASRIWNTSEIYELKGSDKR